MKFFAFDIIAVFVFAVLARMAHGGLGFLHILDTFWPFAIGTLIAWLFIRNRVANAYGSAAVVWVTTVICGLGIWAIRHDEFPHWSFIMVASVMSALLLFGWRLVYNKVANKSQAPA
jgi:hypothetical protein